MARTAEGGSQSGPLIWLASRHAMKSRIMYIEDKSGRLVGPARMGRVTFSKTGRSIYYQGQTFQSLKGLGFTPNYYDLEAGEHFWISGPKRAGGDALYGGSSPIEIDEDVRAVELQGFAQCGTEIIHQLNFRFALAVHSGDFFNPANPPAGVLFDHGGKLIFHGFNVTVFTALATHQRLSGRPFRWSFPGAAHHYHRRRIRLGRSADLQSA